MSLAMPQPDFEPALRLHLSAFRDCEDVVPDRVIAPGDEDEDDDPVGEHPARRAMQLLMCNGDRGYKY